MCKTPEICLACSEYFDSTQKLTRHISLIHKITKKEYYDIFIKKENEGLCATCGGQTSFIGNSYKKYCSEECYHKNKQSAEHIAKRIRNTNQIEKEKKKQETLLKRYPNGKVPYKKPLNKKPLPPRTEEHQRKIIESKRKNNTLKHSDKTRAKIKEAVIKLYESDDPPITISDSSNNNHKHGYCNGIYFRSSYELLFISYCFDNGIKVESAETKEFRVRYVDKFGKPRMYYPDFYLPDYDAVVEIKPIELLLSNENNMIKAIAGAKNHNYSIVTEEDLLDLDNFFRWL